MNTYTVVFLCIQACLVQRVNAENRVNGALYAFMSSQNVSNDARLAVHGGVLSVFGKCTSRAAVAAEPGLIAPCSAGRYGLGAPYGLASPLGGIAPASTFGYRAGLGELAYPGAAFAGAYPAGEFANYGGAGEGNVAVAGELPVAGSTAVAGQVPIMGAVSFGSTVPAAGCVSIAGQCACGCGAPNDYLY